MPRDLPLNFPETEAAPDLSVPTLRGLAWLLRHKEMWPKNHRWDFKECDTCAIGLSQRMWPGTNAIKLTGDYDMARYFFNRRSYLPVVVAHVTPEMVADRIDQHLTRSAT
jgi:hypothetical protein